MVAWRADLSLRRYGDLQKYLGFETVVAGVGIEPSKAEPGGFQSPGIYPPTCQNLKISIVE